ncbi:MAG: excinuclease ABC subunit UvrC [Planctomycetota bacterium]
MSPAKRLEKKLEDLPRGPGVYMLLGKGSRVLYVGKAVDLRPRVRSYFTEAGPEDRPRVKSLMPEVVDLDVIRVKSEKEALLLENSLIKKHKPKGNARLRDDKSYLCVRIDKSHPFPRITFVRKFERDGALYFGPYSDAKAVREAVRVIQAAYGLRVCTDHVLETRGRPCIYYEMGRCSAPCADLVPKKDYAAAVKKAEAVLRGRTGDLLRDLRARMGEYSEAMKYERAGEVRDRIDAVRKTADRQVVSLSDLRARDVVHVSRRGADLLFVVLFVREGKLLSSRHHFVRSDAEYGEALGSFLVQFYAEGKAVPPEILVSEEPEGADLLSSWLSEARGGTVRLRVPQRGAARDLVKLAAENSDAAARRGEAASRERTRFALDALAERLGLAVPPSRIECYDISTIQGTATVGAMVAFEEGLPDKASYRRYKIRTVPGQDDFASVSEVLSRRFGKIDEAPVPDLVIVDGGAGQLGSALEALKDRGVVDVPVVGLAKARAGEPGQRARERVYLAGRKTPVVLPPDAPETLLIARIRDEAHRFAIRYHRKVRSQLAVSSLLDRVEGVGKVWRSRLLQRFGSVTGVREATLEELMLVPGLPRSTARKIHEFLRVESGSGSATKPERTHGGSGKMPDPVEETNRQETP